MKRSISFSIFQYNYLHLMRPQHTLYHQYIFSNHLIGRVGAKWFLCDILHFRCIGMARLAGVYPAAKCLARTERWSDSAPSSRHRAGQSDGDSCSGADYHNGNSDRASAGNRICFYIETIHPLNTHSFPIWLSNALPNSPLWEFGVSAPEFVPVAQHFPRTVSHLKCFPPESAHAAK